MKRIHAIAILALVIGAGVTNADAAANDAVAPWPTAPANCPKPTADNSEIGKAFNSDGSVGFEYSIYHDDRSAPASCRNKIYKSQSVETVKADRQAARDAENAAYAAKFGTLRNPKPGYQRGDGAVYQGNGGWSVPCNGSAECNLINDLSDVGIEVEVEHRH